MRWCQFFTAAALIAELLAFNNGAGAEGDGKDQKKSFRDQYAILLERNIFSRSRLSRRQRNAESRPRMEAPPPPKPEESHVLTGVVRVGDTYVAFIENTPKGETVKLKSGDPVARGKVGEIGFDYFLYQYDGQDLKVQIGQNLAGSLRVLSAAAPESSAPKVQPGSAESKDSSITPTAPSTAAVPASPSSAEEEILKRLRQRRLEDAKK